MNKSEFFAVLPKSKVERVDVPGAGGPFFVRELSVRERIALETALDGKSAGESIGPLVAAAVCDEAGAPILDASDAAAVEGYAPRILKPLVQAAGRLNGLTDEAVEELGNG